MTISLATARMRNLPSAMKSFRKSAQDTRFPHCSGRTPCALIGAPGSIRHADCARPDDTHPRGGWRIGSIAVQLAKAHGATSDRHCFWLRTHQANPRLGCDQAIDYKTIPV